MATKRRTTEAEDLKPRVKCPNCAEVFDLTEDHYDAAGKPARDSGTDDEIQEGRTARQSEGLQPRGLAAWLRSFDTPAEPATLDAQKREERADLKRRLNAAERRLQEDKRQQARAKGKLPKDPAELAKELRGY